MTDGATIRVLIADGTHMSGELLVGALRQDIRFSVIDPCTTARQILLAAKEHAPDIVVISECLEEKPLGGFAVSRELRALYPSLKIIALVDCSRRDIVIDAFAAGAVGIVCRSGSIQALNKCIHSVQMGQIWANSDEMKFLVEAFASGPHTSLVDAKGAELLTKREQDIVHCLTEGLSNREIADRLKLSQHTVKNYIFRVFDKLGVSTRVELVLYAFSQRPVPRISQPSEQLANLGANGGTRFEYWLKASEQGQGIAQLTVGEMYRDGHGTAEDRISAYMWFLVAEESARSIGIKARAALDGLAPQMTSEETKRAERRAAEWLKFHHSSSATSRTGLENELPPRTPEAPPKTYPHVVTRQVEKRLS